MNGAAIHCTFPSVRFNENFRLRLEGCFANVGLFPYSITHLYEAPPPEHKNFAVTAHFFPRNMTVSAEMRLIDWKQCGNDFNAGESVEVMFAGEPGVEEELGYWAANLRACLNNPWEQA